MTIRRSRLFRGDLNKQLKKRTARLQKRSQRSMQLEKLEDRMLLTVGHPILVGIQPNDGERLDLTGQSELNIAPSQLTLRFDGNQSFDANQAELNQAIQITRAGTDGAFDTADDVRVVPGFIGGNTAPNQNEILIRFAETLPDDQYRVEVFGVDDIPNSIVALRNAFDEVFTPSGADTDRQVIFFDLDLGAQIQAIIPQPTSRNGAGEIVQEDNVVLIYFNDDDLHDSAISFTKGVGTPAAAVVDPAFYQLILTTETASNVDDTTFTPDTLEYDPVTDTVKLTFADNLYDLGGTGDIAKTFRMRVGTDESAPAQPIQLDLSGPSAVESRFRIELAFNDNSISAEHQAIIRTAADRIEQVIIGPLDQFLLKVRALPVDGVGNLVAVGFPTNLRNDTNKTDAGLPFEGELLIDFYDLIDRIVQADPTAAGHIDGYQVSRIEETVQREILHALGFGTKWPEAELVSGLSTNDPNYVGPAALAEFNTHFNIVANRIPVENGGDAIPPFEPFSEIVGGVFGEHWREEFFEPSNFGGSPPDRSTVINLAGELMTGFINYDRPNLISRVTVASMADLGYEVDLFAADEFNGVALNVGNPLFIPDGEFILIEGSTGVVRKFELVEASASALSDANAIALNYDRFLTSPSAMAQVIVDAINSQNNDGSGFDVVATIDPNDPNRVVLFRDKDVALSSGMVNLTADFERYVNPIRYQAPPETILKDEVRSSFDEAFRISIPVPSFGNAADTSSLVINSSIDPQLHGLQAAVIRFTGENGNSLADGTSFVVRDRDGVEVKFEFVDAQAANGQVDASASPINYNSGVQGTVTSAEDITTAIADAINAEGFRVEATANGTTVFLAKDNDFLDKTDSVRLGAGVTGVEFGILETQLASIGSFTEPGHRDIEVEQHVLGEDQDFVDEITTIYYNFKDNYGVDADGNPLSNVITPTQRQRAREVMEIYSRLIGIQIVETADRGFVIATGDPRAVRVDIPTGPGNALGIAGGGVAVVDNAESWTDEFGGSWFQEAMEQIGHLLGLGNSFELPGTIQGEDGGPNLGFTTTTVAEPVFPGDSDVLHGLQLFRNQGKDIDLYRFELQQSGLLTAETFAERLSNSSLLDSNLNLYQVQVDASGNPLIDVNTGNEVITLIARNDDYSSEDSFVELELRAGTYYIGVSASGNDGYNPVIEDTGYGGTSEGDYQLRLTFRPAADRAITDFTATRFDGDADGVPGGSYNFWFRSAAPLETARNAAKAATIYVDKSNQPPVTAPAPNGERLNPFNTLPSAIAFINAQRVSHPDTEYIIRVVGNGGDDADITTLADNIAYEIGFAPPFGTPLEDGTKIDVPRETTLMLDPGVIFKMRESSINVGSESPNIDRSGGAVQVLGAPFMFDAAGDVILDATGARADGAVFFTSWNDESVGADTNTSLPQVPVAGDWGGIIFRNDHDRVEARRDFEAQGAFLNYVNHADMRYGGGKVVVNSVQQTITPIHMVEARPTVTFNSITFSAGGAMSADPDAFAITNFHEPVNQFVSPFTSDFQRVGPEIHGNSILNNSANALIVRIETLSNNSVTPQTVTGRWDDRDIVHLLTENLMLQGTPGGSFLVENSPPVDLVAFVTPTVQFAGTLNPGDTYRYRVTFVDGAGNDGPPSAATPGLGDNPNIVTVSAAVMPDGFTPRGSVQIRNLPVASGSFVGRRIYRSENGGAGAYRLIAELNAQDTTYIDDGTILAIDGGILDTSVSTVRLARTDASLIIDPGTVVKLEGSRIDIGLGATLIAEGRDGTEIVFTSHLDDRFGGSGTFDTNNDDALLTNEAAPGAGDWGGIIATAASSISLDHVLITKAGGITNSGGSFFAVNPIEIHQAEARITNSVIEDNEVGQGGQAGAPDSVRFGLGFNRPAGIFVRGAQPIIVGNTIRLHQDLDRVDFDPNSTSPIPAISIDVGSLNSSLVRDMGRSTGGADIFDQYRDNQGPLIRENRIGENSINGMDIRGGVLTTEGVWDDTDIVHVLRDQVYIPDFHSLGGLRLQSSQSESLVVKLFGADAGITATGQGLDIDDRIGGTIQILGQPGFPVIMTSLRDDRFGAGFDPFGAPQTDTNGDLVASTAVAGDWESIFIDRFANDRNVAIVLEGEPRNVTAPGPNATPSTAQFVGDLAPDEKSGDENRRLGFTIQGFLNDPNDLDVYSFTADPGTEVWFDIDRTYHALDTTIDVLDASGQLIASSDSSLAEGMGVLTLTENNPANVDIIDANILQKSIDGETDHYSTNPRDAGFRLVVPGEPNPSAPPTYFVRVRSSNLESNDLTSKLHNPANLLGGLTEGAYQLQIRLGEQDEVAGSTIRFAEIHYATIGIDVVGHPNSSPLLGEATERYIFNSGSPISDNNGTVVTVGNTSTLTLGAPDFIGNVLETDQATISVSGRLGLDAVPALGFSGARGVEDIDIYQFDLIYNDVQTIFNDNINNNNLEVNDALNNPVRHVALTFDLDYSDGFSRANTVVSIYDTNGRLVFFSDDSNIAEDQPQPLNDSDIDDISRGTNGVLDPYIGPVELPACIAQADGTGCRPGTGTYFVVVSPIALLPEEIEQFSVANPVNPRVRLEPVDSVVRIIDEQFLVTPDTFLVENDDLIGPDLTDLIPLQSTTIEAANRFTTTGGANIAGGPVQGLGLSSIAYALGDVKLFVSETRGGTNNDTLRVINAFTGTQTNYVGQLGIDVGDIGIDPDTGELGAFNLPFPGGTDPTVGVYNLLDPGTALTLNTSDDTFGTFHANPQTGSGGEAATNAGTSYNAIAHLPNSAFLYAVSDHPRASQVPLGRNTLYRLAYGAGGGVSPTTPRRPGGRHLDYGTDILAQGVIRTATRFAPINVENNDSFSIRVEGPEGTEIVSYTATGVVEQDQDGARLNVINGLIQSWNDSIPTGVGPPVTSVFERVAEGSAGLAGALNALVHPNPDPTDTLNPYLLYVTSRDTNEVLRYNADTGAFVDVFIPATLPLQSGGLGSPTDLAIDSSGNVYVLNRDGGQVIKFDPLGNFVSTIIDNNPLFRAQDLELTANWSLDVNADITSATLIPHASVQGTGDGSFDYYRFDVRNANVRGIFDIDNASDTPNRLETQIFLYDQTGTQLATNTNAGGDTGDTNTFESFITFDFTSTGAYYLAVGTNLSTDTDLDGVLEGQPIPNLTDYVLHVSIEQHDIKSVVPAVADPVPEIEPNHPWDPRTMAIGPDDNLYLGMNLRDEVVSFNLDGALNGVYVSSGLGGLSAPYDLNFHPTTNELFVTSAGSAQILSYSAPPAVGAPFAPATFSGIAVDERGAFNVTGVVEPRGFAFLDNGNLVVAENSDSELWEYTTAGVRVQSLVDQAPLDLAAVLDTRFVHYSEDFENDAFGASWLTTSTNADGRVTTTDLIPAARGAFSMVLDSAGANIGPVTNEAIWTVNLEGATSVILDFSTQDFGDEEDLLPTAFAGTVAGDGISISEDGVTWFKVFDSVDTAGWERQTIDLTAAAAAVGFTPGALFLLKFQQTDDGVTADNGRGYDDIQLRVEVPNITDKILFTAGDLVAEIRTITSPLETPLTQFNLVPATDPGLGLANPLAIAGGTGNEGNNPVLEVQYVGYGDGREYTLSNIHVNAGNDATVDIAGNAVALPGDFVDDFALGGFGPGGQVTGAETLGGELYFVSGADATSGGGGLYVWAGGQSAFVANIFDTSALDLSAGDEPEIQDLISFGGLSAAPASVENGRYANLLFGIDADGTLVAFNPAPDNFGIVVPGQLEPVFFHNNTAVETGGNGSITGLAFSTLESNQLRSAGELPGQAVYPDPTPATRDLDGAGVDTAPDGSRLGDDTDDFGIPALHFGYGASDFDAAGGAHGSSITAPFSLADYSAEDQPILYFDYYVNLDGVSDTFRVFASGDGDNWELLASTVPNEILLGDLDGTYHEVQTLFNTDEWRQVRVPLENFAGQDNIRLRIDFSTHHELNVGDPLTTGDELRAIPSEKLRDGQSFELNAWVQLGELQDNLNRTPAFRANRFEVDLGHTLVLPSGERIADGDTITLQNNITGTLDQVILEFDDDDLDGIRGNNYGNGVSNLGRVLVPFHTNMTPEQVALVTQIAIETAYDQFIPEEFSYTGGDDRGRIGNTNDTLATAIDTEMMFGSGTFIGTGTIGDNPLLTPNVRFPLKANAADILKDVDAYKLYAAAGSQITVDVASTEDVAIRVFNADGVEVFLTIPDGTDPGFTTEANSPFFAVTAPQNPDPPEPRNGLTGAFQSAPGFVTAEGFYYVTISAFGNDSSSVFPFDPFELGSGVADPAALQTDYTVTISVSNPDAPPINETITNVGDITTVVEDFETVNLDGAWTTSSSDPFNGRIRVIEDPLTGAADGRYALIMDTTGFANNLNEAILSVDVTDLSQPILRFSHNDFNDETNTLPAIFTGSANGDGVSISTDGVNWVRVFAPPTATAGWEQVTINLATVAAANGLDLSGTVRVKFQQFDNFPIPTDGRGYDAISISESAIPRALVHGDGRLDIDHPYTFINTYLNDNRINVPFADNITSSFLSGRQIEGAPGILTANHSISVNAGMTEAQIAEVISHQLADVYNGGDDRLVKRDGHIVQLIGHQVTENDLGPDGNAPDSLGITRFGVTGQAFNFQVLPGDDLEDRTTLLPGATERLNVPSGPEVWEASVRAGTTSSTGTGFLGGQLNLGFATIDNIIVGFAERGEMVINGLDDQLTAGSSHIVNPQLKTDQVFDGAYQLEIRRAADFGLSVFPSVTDEFPYPVTQTLALYRSFDTNDRIAHTVTLIGPEANQVYDGQKFTLSDGVSQLTFEFTDLDLNDGVEAGNVAINYRDHESSNLMAERIRNAINSPQVQDVLNITAALSDGDDTSTDTNSNLVNLFGNVVGRLPNNTIVEDYDPFNFGEIQVEMHGVNQVTITKDGRVFEYTVEHGFVGDSNVERAQGQLLLDSNVVAHTSGVGISIDAATRNNGNPATAVRNFSELNNDRLVPGLTVVNNLLYDNGDGGILLSGDPNTGQTTTATALGPVAFTRIVNNTIFGQGVGSTSIGIDIQENSSPTVLNNIVSDFPIGISIDASSSSAIITGTLYKDNTIPVLGGGLGDFAINLDLPTTTDRSLFVDELNENFYLAEGSRAIDSSVATVADRQDLVRVTSPLGIPQSPILAPNRDLAGQLRVDDPTISTPTGQGQNTFKDRGALDRSDLEGPTALLITPQDNDSDGLDIDPTQTVAVRPTGVFSSFEVSLSDGRGLGSFVEGTGVNDATVLSDSVTLTRNGVFLTQGVDYSFSYNETSNIVRLSALGGIYEPDSVYVITINNRDRHVITAPSGDGVTDADKFTILDGTGSTVSFEFDSGYTIQLPNTLTLQVPVAGGGAGGISDGNSFLINNGSTTVVFEFDSNGTLVDTANTRILLSPLDDATTIANRIVTAVRDAGLGLSPKVIGNGTVHIGGTPSHSLDITGSPRMQQDGSSDAIVDGQTFTVDSPGAPLVTFEFDIDQPGSVESGNVRVPFKLSDTQDDIANTLVQVVTDANVGLDPTNFGAGKIHVGGVDHVIDTANGNLVTSGLPGVTPNLRIIVPAVGSGTAGGVTDGQTFFVEDDVQTLVFEFDDDGVTTAGNTILSINQGGVANTQDEIAQFVVDALNNAGLGLNSSYLGSGVVEVGGDVKDKVDTTATSMSVIGVPGGAVPVRFKPNIAFDGAEMALAIIRAIDNSQLTGVNASIRGGATLFVDGVSAVGNNIQGDGITVFFLQGVKDNAENDLQPNQNSEETRFTILLGENRLDFGDVADSTIAPIGQFRHDTILADNGPRHVIYETNPLFLGARVDGDIDGAPSVDGLGDDIEGNGLVVDLSGAPTLLGSAATTPLEISVTETLFLQVDDQGGVAVTDGETFTVSDGATTVTFELDSNGTLNDINNTSVPFSPGSTSNDVAEAIIAALNAASLGLSPVNLGDGRVHLGSLANHTLTADGPGLLNGGAAGSVVDGNSFTITSGGTTATFEFDSDQQFGLTNIIIAISPALTHLQLAQAIKDAILSVDLGVAPLVLSNGRIELDGDDEDGVTFGGAFNPFIDTPITVTASGAGLLDAWIDFNRDGDFIDPGEKIFNSVALVAGVNQLAVRTPGTFVAGDSFARFRFSTLGGLAPTGLAASGEVEDYVVTLRDGTPPVALDDPTSPTVFSTTEDTPLTVTSSILANDSDADLDSLVVFNSGVFNSRLGAEINLDPSGTFTYDPTVALAAELQGLGTGEVVTDTFTYRAFDGFLFSEEATVSVVVTGENDAPVARRLSIDAIEDGVVVTGDFRGDDIDGDDDPTTLSYSITSTVIAGILTNKGNGTFDFDPSTAFQDLSQNEKREITFNYTATDRFLATSAPAQGTVIITGVNDAPAVSNMLVGAIEDNGPVTFAFAGDDVDNDDSQATLRYEVFGFPTEGTFVNNNDGSFTFDPGTAFQDLGAGQTRDITILYNAIDSHLVTSNLASLTVRVTGRNDSPLAVDDPTFQNGYGTTEDNPISVANPAAGLIVNDSDPDLFDTLVVLNAPLIVTSLFGADVTIQPNGTFVYDPTTSAAIQALNIGERVNDEFIYTLSDGNGGTDDARAVIVVDGRNDIPVAGPVTVPTVEDGGPVTANFGGSDADAEDNPSDLLYAIVPFTGPSEGTVVNNGDGTFTFDPAGGFQDLGPGETRNVTVQYQVIDSRGTVSAPGIITFAATGSNDAPTAIDDSGGFNARNGSTTIDVLANDVDIDGSTLDITSVEIVTGPSNGTAVVNGQGEVVFTSTAGFTGADSFTYRMKDDEGVNSLTSNIATVTITTTDLPIASDIMVTTQEGAPIAIDILANSTDPDGSINPASIVIISGPSNGSVSINQIAGTVTYQPTPGFIGLDNFNYQVSDNVGAISNVAGVTIDVVENLFPWHNPRNRFDVNDDGVITPLDLLLVIAFLNRNGSSAPFGPRPPYYDVVADNFISLIDATSILAALRQQGAGGEGAGEPAAELPLALQSIDYGVLPSSQSVVSNLPIVDPPSSTDEMLRQSAVNTLVHLTGESRSNVDAFLYDVDEANKKRSSTSDEQDNDIALLDLFINGDYGI